MNLNLDFDLILHSDCDQTLNKILLTKSPLKKQGLNSVCPQIVFFENKCLVGKEF